MRNSKIEWCDDTFNPVSGCYHGCEYCYARGIANRFKGHSDLDYFMKLEEHPEIADEKVHVLDTPLARYDLEASAAPYPFGFQPTFHKYRLNDYIGKQGRNIFVCSMADLFGEWVPDSWIEEVFKACEKAPQHNYLFLTKNPTRYVELINNSILGKTGNNMWFGYSFTGKDDLRWWNADYNIFVSIEPILEPVDIPICKWIIVGAETGRRKDKVVPKREWIEHLVNGCRNLNIPIFMKESLSDIWGEPLIQEFPKELRKRGQQ